MTRLQKSLVVAPFLLAVILVVGYCSGCSKSGSQGDLEFPAVQTNLPDPATLGSISGRVVFEGTPPKRVAIDMGDAWCRSAHKQAPLTDKVVVSEGGGLRDVLVRITNGHQSWTFDHEKTLAVMDQRGCVYVPRILAVRTFQPVEFRSSDTTNHNVNTSQSRKGQGFNVTLNGAGTQHIAQFKTPELSMPVLCNIHTWMQGYVHVVDHPFFAVTSADGQFEIKNVPAGTFTLEALHPELGTKKLENFEVKAGATPSPADFSFSKD